VKGDRRREPDEVFFVNLANPSRATISNGQAVGTLRNDDKQQAGRAGKRGSGRISPPFVPFSPPKPIPPPL
jgi:hypothetical protein